MFRIHEQYYSPGKSQEHTVPFTAIVAFTAAKAAAEEDEDDEDDDEDNPERIDPVTRKIKE